MPDYYELNDGDVFSAAEKAGEARDMYRWSLMKYARRAFHKSLNDGVEDLKKAVDVATRWYQWEEARRR